MKILIVGGTGPIGGYIGSHLADKGFDVTLCSRKKPSDNEALAKFPWVYGDYLKETFEQKDLEPYETIVFAAGSDGRHIPEGDDEDQHFLHANGVMVPKFAKLAKDAGVGTFIHIGSFYPHVMPEILGSNVYVRSRHLASQGVCKLASDTFRAMSLDAPFVVGMVPGTRNAMFQAYISYARGVHAFIPPSAPTGGTNFISVRSLAEAVSGAIQRGEGGKAYLLGDENLSFAEYFGMFFKAVGNPASVPAVDKNHPMLPDPAIIQGRGNVISYEPDPDDVERLGFRRADIRPTVEAMVADLDAIIGVAEPVNLGAEARFDAELYALASKYARAMDTADEQILSSIVTDDLIVVGPGFRYEGIAEALALPDMLADFFFETRHVINQQLVEIEGDRARGETFCTANHVIKPDGAGSPNEIMTWEIRYQDQFACVDGKWRFNRRELIVDWIEMRPIAKIIE